MNAKLELALKKFLQAVERLSEAVAAPPSSLQADAVLQRFEFTFELLWKALRIYLLETGGIEVSSPKGTLKAAFREGLIKTDEEKIFLKMLEDRNTSSHVYDQQEAHEIYSRIRATYLPAIKVLISRFQKVD
jgi:nucleotidyltransferase substrate binding protein (TIGR01987 family)